MTCCRRRVVVHGRMPFACHNATGDWQWAKMQSGLLTMLSCEEAGPPRLPSFWACMCAKVQHACCWMTTP